MRERPDGFWWYDDTSPSRRTLAQKIELATARFIAKNRSMPEVVFVNPREFGADELKAMTMRLVESPLIPAHHFCLALEPDQAASATKADQVEAQP